MQFPKFAMRAWAIAAATVLASPAGADAVADFYRGKAVTLSIMNAPGGGYDTYSRLLARHLGRFIPGNPTVVPQNMPGAGGLKVANFIYHTASRDGLSLAMFGAFVGLEPLFGNDQATFDATKYTWIGNMNRDVASCVVWSTSGFSKFADTMERQIVFGSTGRASTTSQHALALKNLLGAKVKVVEGYQGTNEINLAMRRGEVDASCGVYLSSAMTAYAQDLKNGNLRVLIQTGRENVPYFGDAVNMYDLLKTEEDKQVADIIFRQSEIGRPVAGTPGIPTDRANALRTAFMQTVRDPVFLADAAKIGLPIEPMTGEAVLKMFQTFFAAPRSIVERAKYVQNHD